MALKHFIVVGLGIAAYYIAVNLMELPEKGEISFEELPKELQAWRQRGDVVKIHGRDMFYIYQKCLNTKLKSPPTFAIIHGFPSSSYEYHKVLEKLALHGNVVLSDHIGFGFSEAPVKGYTYALSEQAENILAFWKHLGIKKAHVVSHDMGDSILTEILARRHRKMLPAYFDNFFLSVTFTNGGMNFELINFRVTQRLLMYPSLAKLLNGLGRVLGVREKVFKREVRSIWGPVSDPTNREQDIDHMFLLNMYNNEMNNGHNTIYYLWDRYHFEFRWFAALEDLDIRSRFVWSDSDAVSPLSIPMTFQKMVPNFSITIVKNRGHFWMLEDPDRWVEEMTKVLK